MSYDTRMHGLLVRLLRAAKSQWDRRVHRLRFEYLKQQVGHLGKGAKIYGRIGVEWPQRVFTGEGTTLNEGVTIFARAPVTIGRYCRLSSYVTLHTTGLEVEGREPPYQHFQHPIKIGDGVVISAGALINPKVAVGDHCVVGAGAVVTRGVPPYSFAAGVPAKVIKRVLPAEDAE